MHELACDYCGLPIALSIAADEGPQYCCFGCRFASSVAGQHDSPGQSSSAQLRLGLAVFFAMNVMVFTMFLWSQPETVSDASAKVYYDVARYLCLLFSIPVVLLLGPALVNDALAGVSNGRMAATLLLLLGIAASILYSASSIIRGEGHVYFEVGVAVLVLVTLGRWLEAEGKLRTTQSLRELRSLLPNSVRRVTSGGTEEIELSLVEVGDEIRVLPGERIAIDGVVRRGRAAVDEQMLTGEAIPMEKSPGNLVYSGSFNLDGELVVAATSIASEGTFQYLLKTVLEAASQRNVYQRLADRVSAWLLPLLSVAAVLTFVVHFRRQEAEGWQAIEQPLLASLAVLVVACPCALGLATPMALWAALGQAARQQIVFREGDALSQLAAAQIICFDKTGTLTTGQLQVSDCWIAPTASQTLVERVASALAECSNHPAAKAVVLSCSVDAGPLEFSNLVELPGRGIRAACPELNCEVLLGSWNWIEENGCESHAWLQSSHEEAWRDQAMVYLAISGQTQAVFALRDEIRPEAASALAALRELGLELRLLTGDRYVRAKQLSEQLGIEFEAELLPEAKFRRTRELKNEFGTLVMVGDGLNDAPALAAADVGIAMGCGADLSRDAASVCLLSNRLDRLPWAINLARQADRTLRWNLLWAFGYNLAAVPLAAMGVVNPIIAAIAMTLSSLLVISNSLNLTELTVLSEVEPEPTSTQTRAHPIMSEHAVVA